MAVHKALRRLLVASLALSTVSQSPPDVLETDTDHSPPADNNPQHQQQHQCGLYLAASGKRLRRDGDEWGMYAGKDYQKADPVGFPDVAINVHAIKAHNTEGDGDDDNDDDDNETAILSMIADTLVENLWQPDIAGAADEGPDGGSAVVLPGAGLLSAYDVKSSNVDFDARASYQRVTVGDVPGQAHAGRGASSPFYNLVLRATNPIAAGDEVVLNFDAADDDDDDDPEYAIIDEDYNRIDQTVQQLMEFFQKHDQTLDEAGKLQIYRFMTEDFMEAAVGAVKAKTVNALLPLHPQSLSDVVQEGGIQKYSEARKGQPRRKSLEWLEQNGLCMDNIRSGPSKIPSAGRGAFANRKIPKGGLVAPTPLYHVPDKMTMAMYKLDDCDDGTKCRHDDELLRGHQLLLNYMYGHPQSTMSFIPTGAYVNLINHSDEPNSKMQWSTHALHVHEYLELSPAQLLNYQSIGVLMEIVALRDIDEGEEITIDYGRAWAAAWAKHAADFDRKIAANETGREWPIRASDYNVQLASEPVRTETEQEHDPYPEHVIIKVFAMAAGDKVRGDGSPGKPYEFVEPEDRTLYTANYLIKPDILERHVKEGESFVYTIRYPDASGRGLIYMANVPQHAFAFVDQPRTGDQFVDRPFRHYIEIPDDVFPMGAWRILP